MLSVCSCTPRPPGRKSTKRPSNPFLIGPASTQSHQEACRPPPSRFRTRIRPPAWAEFGECNPRTTNFAIGSPNCRLSKAFEFRRNRHNELCSKYEAMGHEGFRRMTGAGAHPEFARRAAPPSLLPLLVWYTRQDAYLISSPAALVLHYQTNVNVDVYCSPPIISKSPPAKPSKIHKTTRVHKLNHRPIS